MNPSLIKLYLFLACPILAVILLPVVVAMFVVIWLMIPFGLITVEGGRIKWHAPWGKE